MHITVNACLVSAFFSNAPATTYIYTLSYTTLFRSRQILARWLNPDFAAKSASTLQILAIGVLINCIAFVPFGLLQGDRKSTRLNSSHMSISYAVFCLKKKEI